MDLNIQPIGPTALSQPSLQEPTQTSAVPSVGFIQAMERELGEMSTNVLQAEAAVGDLAAGRPVELHEVMISLEKARLSVQTFVQVRNKLTESYQDLMRMQM